MKVLVTGSRHWTNKAIIHKAIEDSGATIVVHGDAKGADAIAKEFCLDVNMEHRPYPAKWDLYGRSAGTNRNLQMLQEEHLVDNPIDLVLAFPLPTSIGTYHMMRIAAAANIPVIIIGDPRAKSVE